MSIDYVFKKSTPIPAKSALERNYTERFEFLMKLIRINEMLQKAKIIPAKNKS